MYCPNCHKEYDIDYWRCPNCGGPLAEKPRKAEMSNAQGLGIASMVLGILSIAGVVWIIPAWIMGAIAIILGIVQLAVHSKKGMAIAGIIMGVTAIILSILWLVLAVTLTSQAWENYQEYFPEIEYHLDGSKEL